MMRPTPPRARAIVIDGMTIRRGLRTDRCPPGEQNVHVTRSVMAEPFRPSTTCSRLRNDVRRP